MNYFKVLGIGLLLVLGILLLATTAVIDESGQPATATPIIVNPVKQEFVAAYQKFFEEESPKYLPGAAVAIVMDSSVFFTEGFGYRNMETREKVDKNTVFRIGSLSKGFAGILAGMLEAEQQILLEDKIIAYLPDFKLKTTEQTNDLSLSHVLSHTSGLQYHAYTNLVERSWKLEDIYTKFADLRLIGKPGEVYAYQNAAYCLAGTVMEKASCQPYGDILADRIFKPLDMKGASVSKTDMMDSHNFAFPHVRGLKSWRKRNITEKYYNAIPAGGVNANILDMAKWMELLLGMRPEVMSAESLNKVFSPQVNTNNRKFYYQRWPGIKKCHYAMGWRVLETDGGNLIYHGGQVNNFRSEIVVNQNGKIGICVLSNAKGSFTGKSITEFLLLYNQYKDKIKAWDEAHLTADQDIRSAVAK